MGLPMRPIKIMLVICVALLLGATQSWAQCCANYTSNIGTTTLSSGNSICVNCGQLTPDESTIAAWAARKSVNRQLDWFVDKEVEKADRATIDELQKRVDDICKWAKDLSNHIFRKAYMDWGTDATTKLEVRRHTLDKLDVAESLITGLPTPPK